MPPSSRRNQTSPTTSPEAPHSSSSSSPPQQQPFQHQHRFRVNPVKSYSERMTQTRGELRALVRQRLCEITGEPTAQMRWVPPAYMRDVVARYRVRIEGWPLAEVPLKNLSDVPNLPKLERLFKGWTEGSIRFVRITEEQYNEMVADPTPWIGASEESGDAEADDH